ncbi:MAG: GLUG motif-containing protein, partial [Dehalococcoidia bacterium]
MKAIYHLTDTSVPKKMGILLITAVLIAGLAGCGPTNGITNGTGPVTHPFAGGSGTTADPYQITNWTQLDAVRSYSDKHFILMNDLDSTTAGYATLASPSANGGKGWQPIGTAVVDVEKSEQVAEGLSDEWEEAFELVDPFTGQFDGQEFEISDLFINRPLDVDSELGEEGTVEGGVGLFGAVAAGVIKNVGVINADVFGGVGVGALVGANAGFISDCHSTGSVYGILGVGGLAGASMGSISNSHSTAATGAEVGAGGLVGGNTGTISYCHASGSVTGDMGIGGLIGGNYGGAVNECHATGTVTGYDGIGGLVGGNYEGTVSSSYAAGVVTGTGWYTGGLVGGNFGGA